MVDLIKYKGIESKVYVPPVSEEEVIREEQPVSQSSPSNTPDTSVKTFEEALAEARRANKKSIKPPEKQVQNHAPIRGSEDYEKAWSNHLKLNPDDSKWKPFLDRIAKQESGFRSIQNLAGAPAYGYFQLWETNIGGLSPEEILSNPEKQISLAIDLIKRNLSTFTEEDINNASQKGYTINALLGGAWLGGVGGVRKFLNGVDTTDAHWYGGKGGSSVGKYINMFNFEHGGSLKNLIPIRIGEKEYKVQIAKTTQEKEIGLSNITYLPEDEGMLFIISDKDKDSDGFIPFVMDDTSIPLDIIYLDGDMKVIKKRTMEAFSKEVVYGEADYVLEVNADSGIEFNDELEFISNTSDVNDKMLVLGPGGEVQMTLDGGERIMSIKDTKVLIKFAKKADVTNNDNDFKALGKRVFKFLDIQDSNEKEYV